MKIHIRPIQRRDLVFCAAIVWDNWTPQVAMRFYNDIERAFNGDQLYYVAVDGERVVGFAGMMESHLMRDVWDFIWINVHMDYQNKGIGQLLTEHRIREVLARDGRAIHLMTLHPAFFMRFGFTVAKPYGDWHLMTNHLGPLAI